MLTVRTVLSLEQDIDIMSKLSRMLGNRDLAFEDNLEKGRIWVYHEGTMYTSFCNGFCWRAPGTGYVQIDVWGAAGSGAQMCCCGAGLPGNAPAYLRKCICVISGNYICGYIGRSCNNSSALCFRGCSEASCVCWFGCSHNNLNEGGQLWDGTDDLVGPNVWGWGAAGADSFSLEEVNVEGRGNRSNLLGANQGQCCCNTGQCCTAGRNGGNFTRGCLCAQGGRGGTSFCMDDKSPYSCFRTGYFCGTGLGPSHNMCATGRDSCGMICNWCQNGYNTACGYGGDINCCGLWSCVSFQGCLQTCPCLYQHHHAVAAGLFAEDGGTYTYVVDNESPMNNWSGGTVSGAMNGLKALSRSPSHYEHFTCWNGQRTCGCYEMQGCMTFLPVGVPGGPPLPCPSVRDHAGRGGLGAVRVKFIPATGTNSY